MSADAAPDAPRKTDRSPGRTSGAPLVVHVSPLAARLLLPAAAYLAGFIALTWPWTRGFSIAFWCDTGDGYQNVWNLWWVRTAVLSGRSPWFTPLLHAPGGTSLLGHTLNPFNGFAGIPLAAAGLSLVQAHNAIVAFSFIAAGVTTFWLAMDLTGGAVAGSLVGGFAFTFSSFHLAHAQGHLQLVSVEWLPLFLLAWTRMLRQPSAGRGVAAAVALWLVLLCDYYYLFYAGLTAGLMLAWTAGRQAPVVYACRLIASGSPRAIRSRLRLRRWRSMASRARAAKTQAAAWPSRRWQQSTAARVWTPALVAFTLVALATCGPTVLPLLRMDLLGAHSAALFSADLLGPFVPGGHWWGRRWTAAVWSRLPCNANESSVYLGASVLLLAAAGLRWSTRPGRWFWAAVAGLFLLLSLGPVLQVDGRAVSYRLMPYALLERMLPPLRVSGMPVRMIVMTTLATSLLAACGTAAVLGRARRTWPRVGIGAAIAAALLLDLWPAPLPTAPVAVPEWVTRLRDLPGPGAMVDLSDTDPGWELYYQTVHHRPMAFGYVSRVERAVRDRDAALLAAVDAGRWADVRDRFGVRYVVTGGVERPPARGVVYGSAGRRIIDLRDAADTLGVVPVGVERRLLVVPG
jgi:hypothetical protein